MSYSFAIVESTGRTPADDPKLAAYQYAARLHANGRTYSLIVHSNGKAQYAEFEVESPGLLTLTFYKGE